MLSAKAKIIFLGSVLLILCLQLVFAPVFLLSGAKCALIEGRQGPKIIESPGIHFKWPAPIQRVKIFGTGVKTFRTEPSEVITKDRVSAVSYTHLTLPTN